MLAREAAEHHAVWRWYEMYDAPRHQLIASARVTNVCGDGRNVIKLSKPSKAARLLKRRGVSPCCYLACRSSMKALAYLTMMAGRLLFAGINIKLHEQEI